MTFSHKFKETDYTQESLKKFLSALWVAQEITKLVWPKPQFPPIADRPRLQEMRYGDLAKLQAELEENNRLMIAASSDKSQGKRSRSMPELNRMYRDAIQPIRLDHSPPVSTKKTIKTVVVEFLKACRILRRK